MTALVIQDMKKTEKTVQVIFFQFGHFTRQRIETKALPLIFFHDKMVFKLIIHGVLEQLKTNLKNKFSLQKGSWFCNRVRLNF